MFASSPTSSARSLYFCAEGGAVALPLLCLVEAANANPDDEHWLDMLLQHPATEFIGVEPELWKVLAAIRNTVGRVDAPRPP
jgi:hypothetical protein